MNRVEETPRDEQAEASVIGAALLTRAAAAEAVETLTVDDFYVPRYAIVFDAIRGLHGEAKPTDMIAVSDELHRRGELVKVGGFPLLSDLAGAVPTAANVGYYAEIVQERAILRRLMEAGDAIAATAVDGAAVPDEAVERARALVDSVSDRVVSTVSWIGDGTQRVFEAWRGEVSSATPTQWDLLNGFIGGLRPGAFYVIGARPASGKTTVGLNLAAHYAGLGQSVGFVSLEMTADELLQRLYAAEATVHLSGLLDGKLSASAWEAVGAVQEKITSMPLSVYDSAGSLAQVLSYARTLHRRGDLGLLVVDYLQLMKGDGRAESRQVEVSEFSRSLKLLAKELRIPVIALSQLNRESAGRKSGEPKISDLRESGSLEQDADVVLLLHRDQDRSPLKLKVIVAKNRHGRQGDFTLAWEGQYARASEMAWSPTALL